MTSAKNPHEWEPGSRPSEFIDERIRIGSLRSLGLKGSRPGRTSPAQRLPDLTGLDIPRFTEPALCAESDPDAFYPDKGGSSAEAKKMCRRCPAQTECLAWAVDREERFGIWGGLSERERRRLRMLAKRTPAPVAWPTGTPGSVA